MAYVELQVATNFSFLRGASHPKELVEQAKALGYGAIGVADRNTLAGMVRAHVAAREAGMRLLVGCRLDLTDGASLLVYPTDRAAYSRLTRLLTLGKGRAPKGECYLTWDDLVAWGQGQQVVLLPDTADAELARWLTRLHADFGAAGSLALTRRFRPGDHVRLHALQQMSDAADVATVATNDVLYHVAERRMLQDVVTCIREGCTIDDAGFRRERFADRYLKSPEEMARLFEGYDAALARSAEIADRCRFSLDELAYQYPDETVIPGLSAQQALEQFTADGLAWRYPDGVPEKIAKQARHELGLIAKLSYAPYFLTVRRIVDFAKGEGILCQGRGSAANSTVCYALGITSIDPMITDLLFERFISAERGEPPDIDVDFEHERREEVIQWIYRTYGRERAALTAVVSCYRTRGAVREVGKVLGLSADVTGAMGGLIWGWSMDGIDDALVREAGLNPDDWRVRLTIELTRQLVGFPRHLSQHPGGFVLTRDRLDDLVPIENAAMEKRTVVEWDKDDLEALKMMKVDVLGLGMLGCLRRAFDLLRLHKDEDYNLATVPPEETAVYDMLCRADALGVFQVESRAQMNMLPRLKPREYYDLVIEVAIVRPGPIQGDMVHPYLRRRSGAEKVDYPSEELKAVLKRTLGVPLFQEQAMSIAIVGAGFAPDKADRLRRAMATFKNVGTIDSFRTDMIDGMVGRGYSQEFAERCFREIQGFGSYGFPESHAASFARLVYVSAWVKCFHPEVFCCALLNAQPMGFYAPAQIVRDAREHGVDVLPVDINLSDWDCTLEPMLGDAFAVRLGLRSAKGVAKEEAEAILDARTRPYAGIEELRRRTSVKRATLERLAEADGFGSLGLDRRAALWAIRALRDDPLPLFAAADARAEETRPELAAEPEAVLPALTRAQQVANDYASVGLSLRAHPLSFLRGELDADQVLPLGRLGERRDGRKVRVAGLVLVRQRPGSANGTIFVTLEDETGVANLVVWPAVFEKVRRTLLGSTLLLCIGRVQRDDASGVTHVVVEDLLDRSPLLARLGLEADAPADPLPELVAQDMPKPRTLTVRSRNFH